MTASSAAAPIRLPAWRLIVAVVYLGAMAFVLLSLTPVYLKDLEFQRSVRSLAAQPGIVAMTDDGIRAEVTGEAATFGLPVLATNVLITRDHEKVKIQLKYAVHFEVYQVDLHFHAGAESH